MTPEGLVGTGIGGRTPLTGWRGVQIWVVWRIGRLLGVGVASRLGGGVGRIGRLLGVGVASRFLVVADLDACWVLARRPDWRCMADWTPVGCWRGVQIGDVWRIGCLLGGGVASRLGLYGGLDATYGLGRRPDLGCMADWTPVGGWRGVQIGDVWRIGRHLRVGAASRFEVQGGLDACLVLAWRPDWESRAEWTPVGGWGGVQIGVVGRIGRHLRAGAASRFLVVADLDACWVLARRPDSWWLLIWTPVGCRRGVQIGVVRRIGRHLRVGAASRFGLYGGLDACWVLARRPDWRCMADWTPVGGWRGVQIGVVWRIGRLLGVGVASRFGI